MSENLKEDNNIDSKYKIIIKSTNFTFSKKSYQEQLSPFITAQEFEGLINEVNKLITKSFFTNLNRDSLDLSKWALFVIFTSIILTIIYIMLLALSDNGKDKGSNNILFGLSIFFMVVTLILLISLSLWTYLSKGSQNFSIEQVLKENLDRYLEKINKYFEGYLYWKYDYLKVTLEIEILKEGKFVSPSISSNNLEVHTERGLISNSRKIKL
jgi:hypothetical protein